MSKRNRNNQANTTSVPKTLANHTLILWAKDSQTETDGVSTGMLNAAKEFCNESGVFDLISFRTWCQLEENWIKSDAAGENKVERLPRVWTQVKSDISKAWEKYKLSPAGHDTVNAFRQELQKQRKTDPNRDKSSKAGKTAPSEAGYVVDAQLSQRFMVISGLFDQQKATDETAEQAAERQQAMLDALDEYIAQCKATHAALVDSDLEPADPELDEGMEELEEAQLNAALAKELAVPASLQAQAI
jgi:hypothetical protein